MASAARRGAASAARRGVRRCDREAWASCGPAVDRDNASQFPPGGGGARPGRRRAVRVLARWVLVMLRREVELVPGPARRARGGGPSPAGGNPPSSRLFPRFFPTSEMLRLF